MEDTPTSLRISPENMPEIQRKCAHDFKQVANYIFANEQAQESLAALVKQVAEVALKVGEPGLGEKRLNPLQELNSVGVVLAAVVNALCSGFSAKEGSATVFAVAVINAHINALTKHNLQDLVDSETQGNA